MSEQSQKDSPRNRGMKIQIWIMLIMVGSVMLAGTLWSQYTKKSASA